MLLFLAGTITAGLVPSLCRFDIYSRNDGIAPDNCGDYEQNGALCYPKCESTHYGVGPVCWERCPDGYRDDGASCWNGGIKWKNSKPRGAGSPPNECRPGYVREGTLCFIPCKPGYESVGKNCRQLCPANLPFACSNTCTTSRQVCKSFSDDEKMNARRC